MLKERENMKREFLEHITCNCKSHAIAVRCDTLFDDEVDIQFIAMGGCRLDSLWTRIKMAWEVFRKGSLIIDDIALNKESTDRFIELLQTASNVMVTANDELDIKELEETYEAVQYVKAYYDKLRNERLAKFCRESLK